MSKKIYDIFNSDKVLVGVVNDDLSTVINFEEKKCNSILEVLFLVQNKNYNLYDMKGNLYTLNIHNNLIENIQKYGIGCLNK